MAAESDIAEILTKPLVTDDAVVFGLLMACLGIVFYTSKIKKLSWFYKVIPALLMCYLLPALLSTFNIISPKFSGLWPIAKNYFLPASLILMTLSTDLKGIVRLGPKALIMFFTATVGIILGGPIAILITSVISPDTLNGAGPDAVWRGLATLAGSWIGGGANQTAMLEIYGYNQKLYGGMVFVDIVVANIWMSIILIGIGKSDKINKWLKADNSSIEKLKEKVSKFSQSIKRTPSLTDIMIIMSIGFGTVSFAHLCSGILSSFFEDFVSSIQSSSTRNIFTFLESKFFWIISIATIVSIILSFTKAKNYEGAGASKFGSVFIYILVATIGMKMDLKMIFDNMGLITIGIVWMSIHALLLIIVAKLIKAPYFFLAVGSQANVGGAASAPIVASAFHPSLATVGVLLAVVGYAVGTVGAIICTILMETVSY